VAKANSSCTKCILSAKPEAIETCRVTPTITNRVSLELQRLLLEPLPQEPPEN